MRFETAALDSLTGLLISGNDVSLGFWFRFSNEATCLERVLKVFDSL